MKNYQLISRFIKIYQIFLREISQTLSCLIQKIYYQLQVTDKTNIVIIHNIKNITIYYINHCNVVNKLLITIQ